MFISLAALIVEFWGPTHDAASEIPAEDSAPIASICPVVYPLDQFPAERGYSYFFFGNAFFINPEGYLLTAAHIVKSFRDGGQPYILVSTLSGRRQLQKADLVAEDWEHDVAILRAMPNPFSGPHTVTFMTLTSERPSLGEPVTAVSVFPSDLHDSHTAEAPVEIEAQGQVVDYQFHAESKEIHSELLLFNQKVVPGQSGSPLLLTDSKKVVGIVVGQWLHPTVIHFATTGKPLVTTPGAALRIHYAIALLQRQGISWHGAVAQAEPEPTSEQAASSPPDTANRLSRGGAAQLPAAQQAIGVSPPVPVSVVPTPYPPQALFGGEVVLDALIDRDGRIAELNVVHGTDPFLEPVLSAVRTWTFSPAQTNGGVVEARMGIVFQFPQSFLPKLTAHDRKYQQPSEDFVAHGALPVYTVEPHYPVRTVTEDSIILYALVNQHGQVTKTHVLRDIEPLTAATLAASKQWLFVPGKQGGVNTDSAVVLVVTFRHP
jgi:Trypsin-like peptidase domain/Gram-negative bacterial TonB protein C-terminal